MTTDWKSLVKETVHSFDADEVRGMWDVDWQRAAGVFLADHEAEIAAEPRRWKRVLRKSNAIVFGLAKRLAPPRRLVFALVLLLTVLTFVESLGGDSWSAQASWAFFALFVSVLALAFLLAMELVDKLHFKDELVMARELQAQLVPHVLPEIGTFELGGFNRIANTVGGDLYAPGGVVTAFVAGHPPVLKLDAEGRIVKRLGSGSYPLGIRKGAAYAPDSTVLAPGEMLVFHSDGLPEARGAAGEEFGDARIEHFLFRKAGAAPYEVVASLAQELDRFMGRAICDNDVSIAAVRRKFA